MGWTSGVLPGLFTARAAIAFDLGGDFAARVLETARHGKVIYAAVRKPKHDGVFALVLLTKREDGLLFTKPVSEDMGPVEDRCPARILDLLSEPSNEYARQWRERCRARLARALPRKGQTIAFVEPITFTNDEQHRTFVYEGGSRFRATNGLLVHIRCWRDLDFTVPAGK
jgi:hypothetical protein